MMTDKLTFRRAEAADADAVLAINRAAYTQHIATIGRTPIPMMLDYAPYIRDGEVWLAEVGGAPIACLVMEWPPDALFIYSIAVDPVWARQGIGNRMMALAERRARDEGRGRITLHTNVLMTDNRAWYRRQGFVETGTESTHPDRTIVHLEKRLGQSGTYLDGAEDDSVKP